MYTAVEYENPTLNWLSKHAIEVLIGVVLAFMIWEGKMLLELKHQQTVNTINIEHINDAVNNADQDDKTLRELVLETRNDVNILKHRSKELLSR